MKVNTQSQNRLTLRKPKKIATWNVRGLIQQPGKLQIIEKEMRAYNIDILGISEAHWRGNGHFRTISGNYIYFSGNAEESVNGVAMIVPKKLQNFVCGYDAVSDRVIHLRLQSSTCILHIIQVYAPTSIAEENILQSSYTTLDNLLANIPSKDITILLGDFNSKIGATQTDHHMRQVVGNYGLGERNESGEKLIDFCLQRRLSIMNTYFEHHPRRLYTWKSPGDRYRNQIDFILINTRWKTSVTNAKTFPGADCGSDHQLLVMDFRLRFKNIRKPTTRQKRLTKDELETFRDTIKPILPNINCTDDVEESWRNLKEGLLETAKQCCRAGNLEGRKPWISDETWQVIEQRKQLKEGPLDEAKYRSLSKNIQKRCRKDKEKFLSNICQEIESHSHRNETKDLFQKVKLLAREFKPRNYAIESEHGTVVGDTEAILNVWQKYCTELFKEQNDLDEEDKTYNTNEVVHEPDIMQAEVEEAIAHLKKDKSPGCDNISGELLQNLGEHGAKILTDLCNIIWKHGQWPKDWSTSIFIPLHKKGKTTKCSNYRTISLISHPSKILLRIIKRRMGHYLDQQIPQEQAGFVKGKGTREQILNIRQLIEKCREFNIPMVICFLDYQKAFDCVNWKILWGVLREMGVPEHLIALIRNLYNNNMAKVRIENQHSLPFKTGRGVRQGCILSPDLFNIYGEYIMRKALDEWSGGISIAGKKITNLRFADDTTLIAASEEEMLKLLNRVERESNKCGLRINADKTKIMIVDRSNALQLTDALQRFQVVDQFMYLGSYISNTGSSESDIRRRIGMAKSAMSRLTKIWKDRSITKHTKIKLVQTLIFSIFRYGAETWTIKAADRKRIDAFEMWCWRRMLRIPWTAHRSNESILRELHISNRLSSTCLASIMRFFGHIARRPDNGLERLIVSGNTEGRRSRGRSPTRWTDQIQKATGTSFYNSVNIAQDRCQWREITAQVVNDHDSQ